MIIPIRCFSCGKPIAQFWKAYQERISNGEKPKEILDSIGFDRYCCRAIFISHEDFLDLVAKFKKS